MAKQLAVVVVVSIVFHLLLGWMFSAVGAIAGGWFAGRKGWLIGGLGLAISWGALVMVSIIQAPSQVGEMARVVGELVGGLPPVGTYVITVVLGATLGILGGFVGSTLASSQKVKE